MNTGLTLNELYVDPNYLDIMSSAFAVFREGKKHLYNLKVSDGVASLQQVDRTVSHLSCASDESVDDPKSTHPCTLCNELMYESASPQQHISSSITTKCRLSNVNHRELHCPSGHVFCFSCWRDRLQTQLLGDNNMGLLFCLSSNCGESLDLQWAPALFNTPDLMEKFNLQRQNCVASCLHLKRCPRNGCTLFVNIPDISPEFSLDSNTNNDTRTASNPNSTQIKKYIPLTATCQNGHKLCLSCFGEGHSPLYCTDVSIWKEYCTKQRLSLAGNSSLVSLLNTVVSKQTKCPFCGIENKKVDGCNKLRYRSH